MYSVFKKTELRLHVHLTPTYFDILGLLIYSSFIKISFFARSINIELFFRGCNPQPKQMLMHSNWWAGFLSIKENRSEALVIKTVSRFTYINVKYNVTDHRKLNF